MLKLELLTLVMNSFAEQLSDIKRIADSLPCAVIVHGIERLNIVYINKRGVDLFGTTMEELQSMDPQQYFIKYFNLEDSNENNPKIVHLIKSNTNDNVSYFQQVKTIKEWQLFVSNTRVFSRNAAGEPTHLITTAGALDPTHHITANINRLMDEVRFLRDNSALFSNLTRREKEVLKYVAAGLNSGEIADKLFISLATAETHRRNIRTKLNIKNNIDTVKFAQAFNLV